MLKKHKSIFYGSLKNNFINLDLKMFRVPELEIELGKSFHSLGPSTDMALAPASVLAFGTCRSSCLLVVHVVFSLTVEDLRYHSGYNPLITL